MIAYRLDMAAAALYAAAGCTVMLVGDSKTNDGSTDANNAYGALRALTGVPIVGRGTKAANDGQSWSVTVTEGAGSTSVFAMRSPGDAFDGGGGAWQTPVRVREFKWNAGGVSDFGTPPVLVTLNDVDNYADSDPWEGVPVTARFIYLRDNAMVDAVRVQPQRGGADVGAAVNSSLLGATGIAYIDADCGSGSGTPGCRVRFGTGVDEGGKYLVPMGFLFFARDGAGNRAPGLTVSQMGVGGYTSANVLAMLGGGGAPTCSKANARAWLEAMGAPELFVVDMFTNPAGAEYNELAAGTLTSTIAAVQAVYDVLEEHCLSYSGGAKTPTVLFVNPHQTQLMSRVVCENRWKAILAACQTRGRACCLDLFAMCSKQPNACTVTITGAPTGGTFRLTLGATETGNIAWNATAAQVEAALEALANINGDGKVVVTGGPGPGTPFTAQLIGSFGRSNQLNTTAGSATRLQATSIALTGGAGPTVTVALVPSWFTADGTHDTAAGSAYEMAILASSLRAAAAASGIGTSSSDPRTSTTLEGESMDRTMEALGYSDTADSAAANYPAVATQYANLDAALAAIAGSAYVDMGGSAGPRSVDLFLVGVGADGTSARERVYRVTLATPSSPGSQVLLEYVGEQLATLGTDAVAGGRANHVYAKSSSFVGSGLLNRLAGVNEDTLAFGLGGAASPCGVTIPRTANAAGILRVRARGASTPATSVGGMHRRWTS